MAAREGESALKQLRRLVDGSEAAAAAVAAVVELTHAPVLWKIIRERCALSVQPGDMIKLTLEHVGHTLHG